MLDLLSLELVNENLWFIVFAQAIGLIGMGLDFYAANQKSDSKLMRWTILSSIIFSIHFILLSAIPAAISEIITAARYYFADRYKKIWMGILFIGFYILCAVFIADSLFDFFPFVASVIGTTAIFFLNGISMRILFILGQAMWVVYSVIVFSLGGIILYLALIMMTATTIYRLYKVKSNVL